MLICLIEPDIPTSAQIQAAREKRTRMREGGGASDGFIPLDEGGKPGGSRLAGEDDDDDVLDEEGRGEGRLAFGRGDSKPKQELDDDDQPGDDEDDELKRWELEQIRKGVGTKEIGKKGKELLEKAKPSRTSMSPGAKLGLELGKRTTVTIESIAKDIKSTLASLQEVHKSHKQQLERLTDDIRTATANVEGIQEDMKLGSEEYAFFAGMKIYVADLLDCLGAKAESVESAEDKLLSAYRVRTAKNKTFAQTKRETLVADMKELADEAAGYANPKERKEKPKGKPRARGEEEGWSSDEESAEVNTEFEKSRAAAIESGNAVFADVDDQYAAISAIKPKFEKWKGEYSNSYRQAFISLSMPQIFSPFVRLQLLPRAPLQAGLSDMDWFQELMLFGVAGDQGLEEDDEDNMLVPRLVEKIVVPRAQEGLTHVWVPNSKRSNSQALEAVKEILEYPNNEQNLKELFSTGKTCSTQNQS